MLVVKPQTVKLWSGAKAVLLLRAACNFGYAPRNPTHTCTTDKETDYESSFSPSLAAWTCKALHMWALGISHRWEYTNFS